MGGARGKIGLWEMGLDKILTLHVNRLKLVTLLLNKMIIELKIAIYTSHIIHRADKYCFKKCIRKRWPEMKMR